MDKAMNCPRLPSLPAIAIQVIELCRKDDINIRQIAQTITNDPALSTKILKTVNSSFYGMAQPVSTITHALVILGLNSVKTLALGFSLVNNLKGVGGDDFDPAPIWRRSLFSAVGARAIAQKVGMACQEEIFLGSLIQDLGVLVLLQTLGPEYVTLLSAVDQKMDQLHTLEQERLDLDHMQVGAALAERWKLPPLLIASIRHHEHPAASPEELKPLVQVVALGGKAAKVFLNDDTTAATEDYFLNARDWFNLDQTAGTELLETIRQGTREMGKLFEIQTGSIRDVGSILAEANDVLQDLTLRSQQSATQLEEQNRVLQDRAWRDPLTGAANRGKFNEFLAQHFEHSTRQSQPLTLVMLDADKFKSFNDTYGHMTGDQVLITLSKTLQQAAPNYALVARYGGEEFAVIIPGMNRAEAAQFAEQLRLAVAAAEVEAEDQKLHFTASFGVASYDGVSFYRKPEQLIKAADQAVYAAKAAGRNCVRVFTPKAPAPAVPASAPASA
jgi:diguanylate cyclase (GGDEF)-like protein